MLSRFSSLFSYVIVGLVISAAATPLNPLGDALGDGSKSLSRPRPMKSNDMGRPYGGDKDKSYGDNDKSYGDNDKPYGDKDKHYGDDRAERHGQCSVENQHCCNQVNKATETAKLESLSSSILGLAGIINVIKDSNQLWGFDCSPAFGGVNAACSNQQVCCQDNHMNGLIVVGCNNLNII